MEKESCLITERVNYKTVDYFYAHLMLITYVLVTILYSIVAYYFIDFHAVTYMITVMLTLFGVNLFSNKIDRMRKNTGGNNYGNVV